MSAPAQPRRTLGLLRDYGADWRNDLVDEHEWFATAARDGTPIGGPVVATDPTPADDNLDWDPIRAAQIDDALPIGDLP